MTSSRHPLLLLAAFTTLLLGSCATRPATPPAWATPKAVAELTDQIFDSVNNYRASQNLNRLTRNPAMDRLAMQHCEFLRKCRGNFFEHGKNVSHMGGEYRAAVCMRRYGMTRYSENVAAITSKPKHVAQHATTLWIASKSHHAAMLGDWSDSGIGLTVDADGALFITQIFGKAAP